MPSLEHNGIVEMFRENPSFAPRLLATLFHLEVPHYTSVAVVESALDQLIPSEFRADLVLELLDESGARVLLIVLEMQRDQDPDKKYSWPVYVTVVRSKHRCQAVILVVALEAAVATWAAEPIEVGLGLTTVKPLVLGPAIVPEVTDAAEAEKQPELAVLSAAVHGNGPNEFSVIFAALRALGRLDREHATVYFELSWNALREAQQRALEVAVMERQAQGNEALPSFAVAFMEVAKVAALRDVLFRLLARAGITLADDDRARIAACRDPATLDRWVENVIGAKTVVDVLS